VRHRCHAKSPSYCISRGRGRAALGARQDVSRALRRALDQRHAVLHRLLRRTRAEGGRCDVFEHPVVLVMREMMSLSEMGNSMSRVTLSIKRASSQVELLCLRDRTLARTRASSRPFLASLPETSSINFLASMPSAIFFVTFSRSMSPVTRAHRHQQISNASSAEAT